MSGTIINLIIQLVAGVIGGNAAGSALENASLGGAGNSVAGGIVGIGGGQLLQALIPARAGVPRAADSTWDRLSDSWSEAEAVGRS